MASTKRSTQTRTILPLRKLQLSETNAITRQTFGTNTGPPAAEPPLSRQHTQPAVYKTPAITNQTALLNAGKRVRFGSSDSSDELRVQVREFELDNGDLANSNTNEAQSDTANHENNSPPEISSEPREEIRYEEEQLSDAPDDSSESTHGMEETQIIPHSPHAPNDQSAPSSTSTAASNSRGHHPRELMSLSIAHHNTALQHYMAAPQQGQSTRRHPKYSTQRMQSMNGYGHSSLNLDSGASLEYYGGDEYDIHEPWLVDSPPLNTPALMYEDALPPAPIRRRGSCDAIKYSSAQRRQISALEDLGPNEPTELSLIQGQGCNNSMPSPHFISLKSASTAGVMRPVSNQGNIRSPDMWRSEPLPQGVPLILGPNGLWRFYIHGEQRNVIYDQQRNAWLSRSACDCAPHGRPGVVDWSEDEFPCDGYTGCRKHVDYSSARRVFIDEASVRGPARYFEQPVVEGTGGGATAWLPDKSKYRY